MSERQATYDTAEHAKPEDKYAALERTIRTVQDLRRAVAELQAENENLRQAIAGQKAESDNLKRFLDNALVGKGVSDD